MLRVCTVTHKRRRLFITEFGNTAPLEESDSVAEYAQGVIDALRRGDIAMKAFMQATPEELAAETDGNNPLTKGLNTAFLSTRPKYLAALPLARRVLDLPDDEPQFEYIDKSAY